MKHNIQALSFLIGSFRDIVSSFGENSKSVEFYKRQVKGLESIGQISVYDVQLVEELVGMKNTDSVKWDIANKKLKQFINAMNALNEITSEEGINSILYILEKQGEISETVGDLVREVYGVTKKDVLSSRNTSKKSFGTLQYTGAEPNSIKSKDNSRQVCVADNRTSDLVTDTDVNYADYCKSLFHKMKIEIDKKKSATNSSAEACIQIKNKEAVCSGDPFYYYLKLYELINDTNEDKHDKILRMLTLIVKGWPYQIGYVYKEDYGCSIVTEFKKAEGVHDIINDIDLKRFVEIEHNKAILFKKDGTKGRRC
jgi:hypothetical protein